MTQTIETRTAMHAYSRGGDGGTLCGSDGGSLGGKVTCPNCLSLLTGPSVLRRDDNGTQR